ncbi:uncharacterized protein LOC120388849 [Mauremys reevesii]|uniref:uncharacterized protein LOC120388849 n=1 Tax=Mauremys reevesii TaxID=260615 RepID=UPI00193F3F83|nr:uncharacterized protein LOC120388849 [Mauremys reevesii]
MRRDSTKHSGRLTAGESLAGHRTHVTFLFPALSPSSQEICSAPGTLRGPILSLNQTSARPGDSVQLQCSVFFKVPATRITFCKDGEEVSSQKGLEKKAVYNYHYAVSRGSSGNYSCGYEIKDSDNQVTRSLLSPSQHLSVTGDDSSSSDVGGSSPQGPAMSLIIWAARCALVLLLLVSAPVITFVLEKWGLPEFAGLEETRVGGEGDGYQYCAEEVMRDPH